MKLVSDLDYVIFYAEQLKKDKKLFEQQKRLVEDQIKASSSLFRNAFGKDFKKGARKYLRETNIID